MQNPQNRGSSTGQKNPSSQPFLQDSSLMTALPSPQPHPTEAKLRDQSSGSVPKKESVPVSQPGEVLLNFTIRFEDLTFGDLLGQGAYGKVLAGEWQFNTVAIKQYAAQDFSEKTKNEILKEAQVMATASTQSDYLVRLRGIVLEKPHYSLVMEYLPGGDLFHLLKSSQELTWPMRYRISLDMTIGLHHLHQRSILHRDLKSLNVLLDLNFRAKLADFGLSTLKLSSTSTTAGGLKGTPRWLSPELFKRGAKATTASDIYALMMIFWELVTRQIPFADAASQEVAIQWIMSGEQETIPEGTPEEYKALILEGWDKDPDKRPSAAAVAKRLDTLWQAERKQTQAFSHSSSSSASMSSSASSSISSRSAPLPVLTDAFEGKSLVTFSDPLNLPAQPLVQLDLKLQPRSSGLPELPQSPKSVSTGAHEEAEMKKLLGEVMRLKLEKAEEERRRLQAEKKLEDHARQQAELNHRRAEELKEIQRQPVEPKDKVSPTPPKKEQDLKKLTPLPSLSGSPQTLMPPPKPTLKPLDQKSLSQLQQLLRYVAEGEQDKAEALIQTDKNLLLHAGTVKDLSGREFKQITAFQYALWAMDWHMWTMIQKYLPQELQAEQLKELEAKGTAYGKHFSLQGLTGALQTYVDNSEKAWKSGQRATDHWCKVVGGEQKLLPAHVVNEYCRGDRSFDPCPQEWELKLPRTREMSLWDRAQSRAVKSSWFVTPSSTKRGWEGAAWGYLEGGPCASTVETDLKALQSLWKTRTQQLEALQSKLLPTTQNIENILSHDEINPNNQKLNQDISVGSPKTETPSLEPKKSTELITPASQNLYGLTAPKSADKSPVDQKALSQLLQYVAEGEQDKAEELIKQDKNLLLHAGTIKDLSGREFKPITAFQYALWAMDWHMWTMIQKYLPQEAQAEQLRELEIKGTAYGKHFSLQVLTGALQMYVNNYAKGNYSEWEANKRWKVVGEEQKLLPMHVVNEYCRSDRPFHPCPEEWEAKLPRTREVYVWDSTQSKAVKDSWFVALSSKNGLGLNFAFYRYNNDGCCAKELYGESVFMSGGLGTGAREPADIKALQSLWKTRTEQLELLKSQLCPDQSCRLM